MNLTQPLPVPSHQPQQYINHPPPDNPFFYGWREIFQWTNGVEELVWIPLTLDDVLHPQFGDHVMQNQEHFLVCKDLFNGLEIHLRDEPLTVLLHDVFINWERDDVRPMCPDIAVVRDVTQNFPKGEFFLKQSHGHVDLVLEVTSPSTWRVDVDGAYERNKVQRYAKAGVPCYIIVEDHNRKEGQAPQIIVYWLEKGEQYEQVEPDSQGWYWIPPVQLWIGPYRDWVAWYDEHRNKIGTYIEEVDERRKAQDEARIESDARRRAEETARIEADARRRAEETARIEAEERKRAEETARIEADARKRAEDRIRELEALLGMTTPIP